MSMGKTCCGTDKPPNSPTGSTDDILLVGLQGSGKTLLGLRLKTVYGKTPANFKNGTTETNGCIDHTVPTPKGCPVKNIVIRECGGSMQPLWRQWYGAGFIAVLMTLDTSDAASLAAAGVALYDLLQNTSLSSRPVCLVLTKGDLPVTLSRAELDLCLGLEELQRLYPGRLFVTAVSSVRPAEDCPALRALVDWMAGVKAAAAGLAWRPAGQQGQR
ncbi:hypothetical protein CHLRE_11g467564v5 [Chlamydomonas reinhardtii]|uniref:Uncharacterized protein n=1 Tax=Chlamydomonas reinhardtii TaxID=3055 RepID=A8JF20_CHLRE|nr:uncharacterized protein CHLRE_11g467564v5 [Chlamydomonas reinhardtii]PNW76409.1 hypothetical protein CHLRE_11g467564v5 [Chlamydomonas reinhardtii]|eukprot:XP_001701410.1 ARF-like GTPase [Chlamydomonas reinhardtii]